MRAAVGTILAAVAAATPPPAHSLAGLKVEYRELLGARLVRVVEVGYRAWDGSPRNAYVVLPRWYGPGHDPPIPLVISPHGRGISARANVRLWGALPAFGPFAVVAPEGAGRRLALYSWGWRGQIDDLARMPAILRRRLPWLHFRRVYAVGSSMGGQETLLLVAFHPRLLAGAAALDSATDMAARYRAFARLTGGAQLQELARTEVGGTPARVPGAYARRSPISYVARIAFARVPLELWWSTHDRIVRDQNAESGRLYRAIMRANPEAPVTVQVGTWRHSREMRPLAQLPSVLAGLGIPLNGRELLVTRDERRVRTALG